ncbi:Gluconate transport inducer 1/Pac2 [Penicillium griseofulvum]|uniref:Gluconate transport inducer 1/Pac2 n=1 Tax=Penicillium patulum TaxID=5078 RepID=A0A135LIC9_PENPA|nr:Gluconate transport inducer 1/Pac2 [Penicillium griseofulvum]KXG48698.1 Gluconate transport inducer 1/Pac2 [Penicillium griseofulvum]
METYYGHVRTPADAIILFEACRIGLLPRVQRRLSEKERQSIRSGSVFVWDEREAGMRRWTDGKSWSASRVSGSFLTYREMEGKRGGGSVSQGSTSRGGKTPESRGSDDDRADGTDEGPDGYRYKPDGLMKQSFSITTSNGQHLHLISYYSRSHPSAANLQQPTSDPALRHVRPQKGLYPESTVNDQQNLPVVTRGPMAGAAYPITPHPLGAYPRVTHTQPYPPAYAWPPTPLATPPNVSVQYGPGPSYLPPVGANGHHHHYGPPHHQPPPHQHAGLPPPPHGMTGPYDRPPHMESTLPPAGPPQQPSYVNRSPRSMHDAHAHAHAAHAQAQAHANAAQAHEQRTPPVYGHALVDPRMASPRVPVQSITQSNGHANSPQLVKQEHPAALPSLNPIASSPKTSDSTSAANAVPGISALMNGASLAPLSSATASPGGPATGSNGTPAPSSFADGPRDIPNEKIGFGGEDTRALRQLDRAFIA